jgi:hypothetical protein
MLFAICAGLLHLQVLNSTVSSFFSPPFTHFISGLPLPFLPSSDQVNTRLIHLLPSV